MENSNNFLRQLSRFNEEASQIIVRDNNAPLSPDDLAACRNAERDVRGAIEARDSAQRARQQGAGDDNFAAQMRWQEAELDVRIACADAEAQVWAFIAGSDAGVRLAWLWENAGNVTPSATWQAPAKRTPVVQRFFSVGRVRDDSYRLFAIRIGA